MIVKDLMTEDVITIRSDDTVLDACKRYNRYKIGCLIAMEDNKVVGIITERDMISRVITSNKNPFDTKVEEIMSKNIISIDPMADAGEAPYLMEKNEIKKLPVITDTGKLVGIITTSDVVNIRPNFLRKPNPGEDAESSRDEVGEFHKASV